MVRLIYPASANLRSYVLFSKPVRQIDDPKNVGSRYFFSRACKSVSPPRIHDARTASIHSGRRTIISLRSLATYLYFGVFILATIKCVTSEVRSNLWTAPIWDAVSTNCDYQGVRNWYLGANENFCILTRRSLGIEVQQRMTPLRGSSLSGKC